MSFIFFIIISIPIIILLYYAIREVYSKYKMMPIKEKIIMKEKENQSKILFILDYKYIANDDANILDEYVLYVDDSKKFQKWYDDVIKNRIQNLELYIETSGGNISDNDIIVHLLLNYPGKIKTYISKKAFSAGTLLALCGHEINMLPSAILSPTDPIVEYKKQDVSVATLIKLKKKHKNLSFKKLINIHEDERLYYENINLLTRLIERHTNKKNKMKKLINMFGSGEFTHSTPFTEKYLKKMGLNIIVRTKFDFNLMKKNYLFIENI